MIGSASARLGYSLFVRTLGLGNFIIFNDRSCNMQGHGVCMYSELMVCRCGIICVLRFITCRSISYPASELSNGPFSFLCFGFGMVVVLILVGSGIEPTGIRSGCESRFCKFGTGVKTNENSAGMRILHAFQMSCILCIKGLVICYSLGGNLRREGWYFQVCC